MIIYNIVDYVVHEELLLQPALDKLNSNEHKILFLTKDSGELVGSISDGDFRRWILKGNFFDESTRVLDICNFDVRFIQKNVFKSDTKYDFSFGRKLIPVVDERRRISFLITDRSNGFQLGNFKISETSEPFIIAEIGNNHQGCIETAKSLVMAAKNAGAHCAKFQMRSMDALYGKSDKSKNKPDDLGSEYTIDLLNRFQLADAELYEVFDFSAKQGLLPLCTPWDLVSLAKLENFGLAAYKVASADFTNYELLSSISALGKPMLCSTGMSNEGEVKSTIKYLENNNANYMLLHCNSTYPTPYKDVHLHYLTQLQKLSDRPVGYSGHEIGIHIPIAASALGAKVIEKHITFDKNQEGTDHKVSLLPHEFQDMCSAITDVCISMGEETYARELTQGELINRQTLAKSIFATKNISKGDVITRNMLAIRGPGRGIQPNKISDLLGVRANRNIEKDTELFEEDLTQKFFKKNKYLIQREHGIPVRYHDYEALTSDVSLNFVEFHFSYNDLNIRHENYLNRTESLNYSVHCPEMFENDHILDLTAIDEEYRNKSIQLLNKTIDVTLELKQYFPKTSTPTLVVNVGGWSKHGFLDQREKIKRYEILKKSLSEIKIEKVNFAIQTMPPFPWHFGGRSHHNLFVDPHEIITFCSEFRDVSICLDTSHSMMACTYYGWKLDEFIKLISPYTSYIHLADAKGIDGEGVAFGHGDIDFQNIWALLNEHLPNTPFIPEVWQGHVNEGTKFWKALEYIEKLTSINKRRKEEI